MRSEVMDRVRRKQRRQLSQLTPEQRLQLALALGRRDIRIYASARGISCAAARKELRRKEQLARAVPSQMLE